MMRSPAFKPRLTIHFPSCTESAVTGCALTFPSGPTSSTDGASVLLVGPDGKVSAQPVTADSVQDGKWIVSRGLKAGDRIIVEVLQKTKPGAIVKPMPWQAKPAEQKPN